MKRLAYAVLALAWAGTAAAHEVQHDIVPGKAVMVRLHYADGEPFAYEQYELFAKGRSQPVQTGRTDYKGRVLFASDDGSAWRLRSFSADGHGVDLSFDAQADARTDGAAAPVAAESGRAMRLLTGLVVILVGFAALALLLRRRRPA